LSTGLHSGNPGDSNIKSGDNHSNMW